MADNTTLSGLSDAEAREFHGLFITGFLGFTAIAAVAHLLVWFWRPWIPPAKAYSFLLDHGHHYVQLALTHLA